MSRNSYSSARSHPFVFYALIFLGLTLAIALTLWWLLKLDPYLAWFVALSPVTLVAYRFDKIIAGSERLRVPERVLLLLALLGGTPGAVIGMWFLGAHHKTSKQSFIFPFLVILVVQAVLVGIYLWLRFHG